MKKCIAIALMLTVVLNTTIFSSEDFFSYWSFDSTTDSQGETISEGVTPSQPVWVNGKIGKAMDFSGGNKLLRFNDYTKHLSGATAISVSGYFKNFGSPSGADKNYNLFKININGSNGGFNLYLENNQFIFEARSMPDDKMQAVKYGFTDSGKWHSFVAVADYENSTMTLYIDGEQVATGKAAFGAKAFEVGSPTNPDLSIGGAGSYIFNGALDEFKIYKRALTKQDVDSIESNAEQMSDSNPYIVGAWSFEEENDEDTRGKGIAISAGDYLQEQGKMGKGLSFSGKTKPLHLGKDIAKELNRQKAITVSMWFKNNSIPQDGSYSLFKTYSGAREGFEISLEKDGIVFVTRSTIYDIGTKVVYPFSDVGSYHHIIASVDFSSGMVKLYLDGKEVLQETASFKSPTYRVSNINGDDSLGGFNTTTMFDGSIDELVILSKTLDDAEVKSLYETSANEAQISKLFLVPVNFTDISGHWAEESIIAAAQRSIIKSENPEKFYPELNVKRWEFVEMICSLLELPPAKYKNVVRDITQSDQYSGIFQAAMDKGLIERHMLLGQSFYPQAPITIQEALVTASIAYDFYKDENTQTHNRLSLVNSSHWTNIYLENLRGLNLIRFEGMDAHSLLTRAQAAYILGSFID
ncbi:MAG: S-layer homology domain-containing protein [Eubacteriales bacterium]|nr:S-layer homology domain-containing protein [Eubacteriales bacterium]